MKNVFSKKVLTGAIVASIAIPTIVSASTSVEPLEENMENQATIENEMHDILSQFKSGELSEDEVIEKICEMKPKGHHPPFQELDEETRQKLDEIKGQVEAGEITEDEAKEKMDELGVELPEHPSGQFFDNLTDEQKAKVEEIRKQIEAGEMTKEEAKEQFEEMGIDIPHHRRGHHFRSNHSDISKSPSTEEESKQTEATDTSSL
ncbi:hypothetical protein [Halobacillus mangrovi]|uniref:Uncharacterized protein n=1 Tax=Halobacillus mangrovi TaxID=402384 RepID=A0A1W5ZYI9_9BACI|nr:hypothetical protein [Halobacillus mangrovi]ARI78398.1 hypothetical protein HM131_16840 [Halobacillus mangrovi]